MKREREGGGKRKERGEEGEGRRVGRREGRREGRRGRKEDTGRG